MNPCHTRRPWYDNAPTSGTPKETTLCPRLSQRDEHGIPGLPIVSRNTIHRRSRPVGWNARSTRSRDVHRWNSSTSTSKDGRCRTARTRSPVGPAAPRPSTPRRVSTNYTIHREHRGSGAFGVAAGERPAGKAPIRPIGERQSATRCSPQRALSVVCVARREKRRTRNTLTASAPCPPTSAVPGRRVKSGANFPARTTLDAAVGGEQ